MTSIVTQLSDNGVFCTECSIDQSVTVSEQRLELIDFSRSDFRNQGYFESDSKCHFVKNPSPESIDPVVITWNDSGPTEAEIALINWS